MYILLYDYFPLIMYFILFIYIIKKYPFLFILFFYLFIQQIKNILSNLYVNINAPVFMREVEKYSTNDASLLFLIFLYIPALIVMYFMYKYKFKSLFIKYKLLFFNKRNSYFFQNMFLYGTIIIELVLILHIISYNTPLFNENINKNNYWTDYALIPQIKILSSQLSLLLFINGFFYAKKKLFFKYKNKKEYLYNFILLLAIFYYILMKQKFGGPLLMFFSFYLPYFVIGIIFNKINFLKLIKILFILFIILIITVYGYFYIRFGNDAVQMILERVFSLQSEIWEVTYQYFISNKLPFDNNEFLRELSIIFGFNNGYTGMHYVMSKVMEPDYFNFFMQIHINLSSAYPSYLFYIFEDPYIELIFIYIINIVLYGLYIFLGFKVIEKLLGNKVIVAGLYLKLFFSLEAIIGQVYLNSVFNFKEILFIILLLLVESGLLKYRQYKGGL